MLNATPSGAHYGARRRRVETGTRRSSSIRWKRRLSSARIEGASSWQYGHAHADGAEPRRTGRSDGRVTRVEHDRGAGAEHLPVPVGIDTQRCALVDTDADERWPREYHADQPVLAHPLDEVLVDDRVMKKAEPWNDLDDVSCNTLR